jgi:hypothetical protein
VTRDRGHVLQRATAAYLSRWWPNCESTPNGRPGRDILGTPGVWWEVKTSFKGKRMPEVVRDAASAAGERDLPVVVYWPPGVGAGRPGSAIAILPLPSLMELLSAAEYAPVPAEGS